MVRRSIDVANIGSVPGDHLFYGCDILPASLHLWDLCDSEPYFPKNAKLDEARRKEPSQIDGHEAMKRVCRFPDRLRNDKDPASLQERKEFQVLAVDLEGKTFSYPVSSVSR